MLLTERRILTDYKNASTRKFSKIRTEHKISGINPSISTFSINLKAQHVAELIIEYAFDVLANDNFSCSSSSNLAFSLSKICFSRFIMRSFYSWYELRTVTKEYKLDITTNDSRLRR